MSAANASHGEGADRVGRLQVHLGRPEWARYALGSAILFGSYVGTAKLGLSLSVAHGVITPVWAPSGISLAALTLFGRHYWPAVFLAAWLANATSGLSVPLAAGIAAGNCLAAVLGSYALQRARFRPAFPRVYDVLTFVVLGALGSTLVSATNGTTLLYLTDHIESYGSSWVLWWFGDTAGILLVAPLIFVLVSYRRHRPTRSQAVEWVLTHGGLAAACSVVFLAGLWRYPYAFFPFLLWAPLRFRQLGAATAAFLVGAIATIGVVNGNVPIGSSETRSVQILQALIGVVAVALLLVGVTVAERETLSTALRQAQALTHIGSWEWDIPTNRVTWSDEMFRIFGLEPQSRKVDYAGFLSFVHPDDRPRVESEVQDAYEHVQPFLFEHRAALPDGSVRLIEARGDVEADDAGAAIRMWGTGQDITQQQQVDQLRRDLLATVSHELRTPLTSVLGYALTLQQRRRSLSQDEVDRMIEHIAGQADRLSHLLDDLLDLDRHRRGAVVASRTRVEIRPLLEGIVAGRSDGPYEIRIDAEPQVAEVDPALFDRIVDNLLANAMKHTPPGTRITLRTRASGNDLVISVDDQGPGVPPHQRETIFELFDRGTTDGDAVPGTGIGLAVVAQFAALHGGRAWVEDAEDGGASFRVLLRDALQPAAT